PTSLTRLRPISSVAALLVNAGKRRTVWLWSRNSTYHFAASRVRPLASLYVVLNTRNPIDSPTLSFQPGPAGHDVQVQVIGQPVQRLHGQPALTGHEPRQRFLGNAGRLPDGITGLSAMLDGLPYLVAQLHALLCHYEIVLVYLAHCQAWEETAI